MNGARLADLFLLPKGTYLKLTEKKYTLYLGILFVGLVDMVYPVIDHFGDYFVGKPSDMVLLNAGLLLLIAAVIGTVDVVFFSFPIFDFIKLVKKLPAVGADTGLMRVMKTYILVHFLLVPFGMGYSLLLRSMDLSSISQMFLLVLIIIENLLSLWFSAAFARGVSVNFGLGPILWRVAMILALIWGSFLSYALNFMQDNWFLILLR